jgi:hypothetical protein
LLDWAIPKYPGLEALRELSVPTNASPVRVILLVAAAEKSRIVEALRGVVVENSAPQSLIQAIQTVMAEEYCIGRERVSDLVQYLRTLMQSSHDEARLTKFGLSRRELDVVAGDDASGFASLPDRSYRCKFPCRAAETFTSEQNVHRCLCMHRICYPPDCRHLAVRGLTPRKIHNIVDCSSQSRGAPHF